MQKYLFHLSSNLKHLLFIVIIFSALDVFAEVSIPELNYRVNDLSGILDSMQEEALEDKLKSLENKKGSQVAILIIPTTEEESIEQFSFRVVEKWKLGRKNIDDGVLILIATKDRKMRIEVGYGLEGILPDVICKRIISEQMKPHFKEKNYYEGIDNAVESISKIINGETLPPPDKKSTAKKENFMDTIEGIFIVAVFLIIFTGRFIRMIDSTFFKIIVSGIFGFIGALIGVFFLISTSGFLMFIFLLLLFTFLIYWLSNFSGGSSSGSYWGGSSSSSSWSSSSSDSFSGGGGSFGGGGASGDW